MPNSFLDNKIEKSRVGRKMAIWAFDKKKESISKINSVS